MKAREGRVRIVLTGMHPELDGGRFPIKRTVGERVIVEVDIFSDGHDALSGVVLYRHEEETQWSRTALQPVGNDRWSGAFIVTRVGRYRYTVQAWIDRFASWQRDLVKRIEAGQDIALDLRIGAALIEKTTGSAMEEDAGKLKKWMEVLRQVGSAPLSAHMQSALAEELGPLMEKYPDQQFAATYDKELSIIVDREQARFSAWYEMFPRSCGSASRRHGAFTDCEARLPYIAAMGFDVLYFPPIHPIGFTERKGKNNTLVATADDPGSPWAIGADTGGHDAIHPQLGTLEDFRRLIQKATEQGIEIALDLAFQCAPDHPYVKIHQEWFRRRPDGSIQYAENPPKKYQDIYPFDFETDQWQALWEELKSIVLFWIDQGVRIFRVDNPHTKSFHFWEWLIGDIKEQYPEVLFLAEAFTRPKVMYYLAKLGFSQSYTYFAWRNTKQEISQYFTELTQVCEYFRPNLWPNTPDILTEYLQLGGRPAFLARLVLAATLGASYGIYGPAFELCENQAREVASEEYLNSEKYESKHWEITRPDSLKDFIARVNRIRQQNPALRSDWSLRFHSVDNEQLICYSKCTEDYTNVIVVVVNLDPHHRHSGWVDLSLAALGLDSQQPYQVHELLSDARYLWHGSRNYVELNPQLVPAHIFQLRRRVRTERDFDYYM